MKIPKGGLHNINQSSQANINDSWNVLATDENNAVLIAVDKCGNKKIIGDTSELTNYYTKTQSDSRYKPVSYLPTWDEVSNKPATYTPSPHTQPISEIIGLQTALDGKLNKLSSFDESILIESDGNIENNVSLFTEYFNTQNCILAFTPIQILGIYKNGLKLLQSEYTITLPKTISINTYIDENIEIQYTHLKN